ncbi:hypothetical protein [Desulfonatronovibrio magnus]|uniref:hypothetical protein n=1 Tax=Desulfonatronovibrio magnus TaxID=698827 RepID=UPI0005EB574C|nr:hypothetical protein [Desulfonatronovibrio magnus]
MEVDLQLAKEKGAALGRDFLTWLWFRSEIQDGVFQTGSGQDFALYLEQKIVVEGGEGDSLEKAVCTGIMSDLWEARQGLRTGKKVVQAKIKLEQDDNEWLVQLDAADFAFSGLKTPKVDTKQEEGDDPDSAFLEKMFLLERAMELIDEAYKLFLHKRMSIDWQGEREAFQKWLHEDSR